MGDFVGEEPSFRGDETTVGVVDRVIAGGGVGDRSSALELQFSCRFN